jgi:hypothetical protein
MLPGFRFLLAAIMLSMSLLVFGLGAAALLRVAHDEFASNPSWRGAPEVTFAQPAESTPPVLAMLSVDQRGADKSQDDSATALAPAEPAAAARPPEGCSGQIAATRTEEVLPRADARPDAAKPEVAVAENAATGETAPVPAERSAAAEEIQTASIARTETPSRDGPPAVAQGEQIGAQTAPGSGLTSTKIATLGGPPVEIATPKTRTGAAKPDQALPDQNAAKNSVTAKRAARLRRITAARARLAAQQQAQWQQANPFFPQPTARAR